MCPFWLVLYAGQDIIHCHDWSSAPVAWLFKDHYMHYGLSKARVVFTIHNLEFGAPLIGKAMTHSDKATTVSTCHFPFNKCHSLYLPFIFVSWLLCIYNIAASLLRSWINVLTSVTKIYTFSLNFFVCTYFIFYWLLVCIFLGWVFM